MNGEDGSLPPAGRFMRIEESLARIEDKLDVKADTSDVEKLATRVLTLELNQAATVAVAIETKGMDKMARKMRAMWVGIAVTATGVLATVITLIVHALSSAPH